MLGLFALVASCLSKGLSWKGINDFVVTFTVSWFKIFGVKQIHLMPRSNASDISSNILKANVRWNYWMCLITNVGSSNIFDEVWLRSNLNFVFWCWMECWMYLTASSNILPNISFVGMPITTWKVDICHMSTIFNLLQHCVVLNQRFLLLVCVTCLIYHFIHVAVQANNDHEFC